MRVRSGFAGFVLALVFSSAALATALPADPPARVGRVSYLDGDVLAYRAAKGDWVPAERNYPVTQGQSYWTDAGRAEIQVGGVLLWLDHGAQLTVNQLDYGVTQLDLPEGGLEVRIWTLPRGGVAITTPQGLVRLGQAGIYRLDAGHPNGGKPAPLHVTVLQGQAEAPGPGGGAPLSAGQEGVDEGGQIYLGRAYETDLDLWARNREAYFDQTGQNLSEDYTGYNDLGRSGDWSETDAYGDVWFPDVAPEWAPYRYGYWDYCDPWGWTWIDDAPWGFAPFHYGRWVTIGGRWGWTPGGVPGHRGHRRGAADFYEPVYAPALVTFIGGADFGLGVAAGAERHIGWAPLGPGEVYLPPYRVSNAYARRANEGAVTAEVINAALTRGAKAGGPATGYRNADAATVVSAENFRSGASVDRTAVMVSPKALSRAAASTAPASLPAAPTARASAAAETPRPPHPAAGMASAITRAQPPVLRSAPAVFRDPAPVVRTVSPPSSPGRDRAPGQIPPGSLNFPPAPASPPAGRLPPAARVPSKPASPPKAQAKPAPKV